MFDLSAFKENRSQKRRVIILSPFLKLNSLLHFINVELRHIWTTGHYIVICSEYFRSIIKIRCDHVNKSTIRNEKVTRTRIPNFQPLKYLNIKDTSN